MILFIQGLFFEDKLAFGIGCDHERPEIGACVYTQSVKAYGFFAGVISRESNDEWIGSMMDIYGVSSLTNIRIADDLKSLSFDKQYEHRNDTIHYEFKDLGGTMVGEFSGRGTGSGAARCILIKVEPDFFKPARD